MAKKILKIGFDFDGVIAYNPVRILRFPVALFKRFVLGKRELKFYYPKSRIERRMWQFIHETSYFPAVGFEELKNLLKQKKINAYLITARYSFLEDSFHKWLNKHKIDTLFSGYFLNKKDEQPHLFKERMIKKLKLDYYVEDNWDIVEYLNAKCKMINDKWGKKTEIHWVYNILDRFKIYKHKHPYLSKFIEKISQHRQ